MNQEKDGESRDTPKSPASHPVIEKEAEAARELLQRRLGQIGLIMAVVQLGLSALWILVAAISEGGSLHESFQFSVVAVLLIALSASAAVFFLSRRRPYPLRVLWTIDAAAAVVLCASYAFLGYFRTSFETAFTPVSYFLLLRAVFLPCTSRRTLAVSAAAFIPGLVLIPWMLQQELGPESWLFFAARLALWIVLPAVVSHVIYGLRREAEEAKKVGPYTLEKLIAKGGMGEVYKARHALLRRETAVKILSPDPEDENSSLRFEHEVQVTSQLTHPNTVAIYDYGRAPDGRFYYVMEYLPGMNLGALVKKFGPQPAARVIHILSQVCGSLGEAHAKGIIHRDIKPGNLILCARGGIFDFVKVVDFGLVKEFRRPVSVELTAPNIILGTVHYMPPEFIATPGKLDGRSDLYALGAVGYFLLTGEPPYTGRDIIEVSVAQLSGPPRRPSEALGKAVPADIEDILLGCLDKEMDRRPRDVQALQQSLSRISGAGKWGQEEARSWWQENIPSLLSSAEALT